MELKKLTLTATISAFIFSAATNATLGPIPITLNTEYRTNTPVVGSIASTIELTSDDIVASGANSFLELLATLPSLNLFNAHGNVPSLFIRGSESRHTLLLIDGVKTHDIASPDGGVFRTLENIPLAQIESVEIIKGPYSSLYGSGAIGGVIQVFTKKGEENEQYSNIKINASSHNTRQLNFSTGAHSNKGFINFNGGKYKTNGISARKDNSEDDGANSRSFGFKIGYDFSKKTTAVIGYLKSKSNTEYDDDFGILDNKFWYQDLENLNIKFNHQFNQQINSKLSLSEIKQNRDSFTDGMSDGFNKKNFKTKDLTLLNDIKFNNALLNIGISKIKESNITDNQSLSNKDIFAQWQKNIASIDVNMGVRFIDHSGFGNETIYNLGVAKAFNNGIRLTGAYGSAFNAPSLYQLFDATNGNSDLEPETAKNIEIGIEKQYNWGSSNIRFYKNEVKNLIDAKDRANFDYSYINKNKLKINGIELSAQTFIKGYLIDFSHNYVKSELNNSGKQQARRPKNTTNLTFKKQYDKFNSSLQIIKKSSSIDGKNTLGGYTLVNLSTQYRYHKQSKISLYVNNALDKDYVLASGYNQFGRTFNLGLTYDF